MTNLYPTFIIGGMSIDKEVHIGNFNGLYTVLMMSGSSTLVVDSYGSKHMVIILL